jgi:hypothetical protein
MTTIITITAMIAIAALTSINGLPAHAKKTRRRRVIF